MTLAYGCRLVRIVGDKIYPSSFHAFFLGQADAHHWAQQNQAPGAFYRVEECKLEVTR